MHCFKCKDPLTEDVNYRLHKNCFRQWFKVQGHQEEFLDIVLRSQSQPPIHNSIPNSSFFQGAYRKYSACLDGTNYILKVQEKDYPELPAAEYLCNQIFTELNIDVPEYYLIGFPENQHCFITKNFMSKLSSSSLVHIYHYLQKDMPYDCETLLNIIERKTRNTFEQHKFIYLTLADSLIGNHDRHGRNLGFIESFKGRYLAPFYDNPSALAIEDYDMLGADLQPRGAIFTQDSDKPSMKDYVLEWKRLGYNEVVNQFRRQLSLDKITALVQDSYLSDKRKKAMIRLITSRSKELCES